MAVMQRKLIVLFVLLLIAAASTSGCGRKMSDPQWATQPYPAELHSTRFVDMQVFRHDTDIEITNTTATSYSDFNLWVNQRYVRHVDSLAAGDTIRLSLWDFYDEFGDRFNAGGFFRTFEPTPVRLVQIETNGEDRKLVGVITIRREDIVLPEPRQ